MKKNAILTVCLGTLLLALITSCGNEAVSSGKGGSGEKQSADTVPEAALQTEASVVEQIPDGLPEKDLGGYSFRMLVSTKLNIDAIYAESETGAIVNDAVYSKIRAVEERFNCDISLADGCDPENNADPRNTIMAGEDAFDIAMGHDITFASESLEGLFLNLYDVPHLDFSKPWWPDRTVKSLSVGEQMYLFSNFISYYSMSDTRVMYFNKKLLQNLDMDSPYQLVYDHKWTLDRMNSMVQDAYADLNGDGKADAGDQYGYMNPEFYYCFLECFMDESYRDAGNGTVEYSFDTARAQVLVDKLYDLLFGGAAYIVKDWNEATAMFSNGNVLFTYGKLSHASQTYCDANITYGILPMPMLDESQDTYMAGCTDRPVGVPVTADPHIDETGLIIEAMSAEGYRKVFPAYFETALKTRYSDQSDDAAMIDIVMNNVVLSFTYMYGNNSPYNSMLQTLFKVNKPTKDVASYAAKIEKAQQKRVAVITEKFADLR